MQKQPPISKLDQIRALGEAKYAERQQRNPPPEKRVRAVKPTPTRRGKPTRRAS